MQFICCPPPRNIYLHTTSRSRSRNGRKMNNRGVCVVAGSSSGRNSEVGIDKEKAREALKKLDQQLQSISDKPPTPPKIRAAEVKYTSEEAEIDRSTAQSSIGLADGSFQTSLIVVLLIFTIFYNVIFITVIKPSIDGPDTPPTTLYTSEQVPKAPILP